MSMTTTKHLVTRMRKMRREKMIPREMKKKRPKTEMTGKMNTKTKTSKGLFRKHLKEPFKTTMAIPTQKLILEKNDFPPRDEFVIPRFSKIDLTLTVIDCPVLN